MVPSSKTIISKMKNILIDLAFLYASWFVAWLFVLAILLAIITIFPSEIGIWAFWIFVRVFYIGMTVFPFMELL